MKLSTKLTKKISDFSVSVKNFSTKIEGASEVVDNFSDLVSKGDADRLASDKQIEKTLRKFNKVKTFCKNFAEEAADITDQLEDLGTQIEQEASEAEQIANDAETTANAEATEDKVDFGRKIRILARRFSGISNELNDIVSEATSVVNMTPEDVVKVTDNVTQKAESVTPKDGDPADGAELTTQKADVQTAAASVNFSYTNYIKFAAKSIVKSFAEIIDDVKESAEDVDDLSNAVEQEPEIPPAEGNEETPPPTTEAPTEVVEPAPAEDTPPPAPESSEESAETQEKEDLDANEEEARMADEVLTFGEDAILAGNDAVADELKDKLDALEAKTPGKGEEVMEKLENFSTNLKKFKNFSTTVFDKIKEFAELACESVAKKNIDAEDLGSKAEDLEKNQPGAGELLTSVLECFGKLINAIKVPDATTDKDIAPEFHPENFCGTIDKFVSDIDIADKRFAREVKTKCFALENAIEDGKVEEVKQFCGDLATALDSSDDAKFKAFGEELVKFAEEYADANKPAEVTSEDSNGVPENISKADGELNQVLDKLSENGEHLKPEVATFAKKLCAAYKSMKCFTEEDLEAKLENIESLKSDMDSSAPAPETPAPEDPAPEVKPEVNEESQLIVEEEVPSTQLPSDASLQNFSVVSSDDPLGHLASLDIR